MHWCECYKNTVIWHDATHLWFCHCRWTKVAALRWWEKTFKVLCDHCCVEMAAWCTVLHRLWIDSPFPKHWRHNSWSGLNSLPQVWRCPERLRSKSCGLQVLHENLGSWCHQDYDLVTWLYKSAETWISAHSLEDRCRFSDVEFYFSRDVVTLLFDGYCTVCICLSSVLNSAILVSLKTYRT